MTEHTLDQHILGDLRYFCMFIGYPYSGHSLVGSIIDAHPNAVISHELHIGKLLKRGLTREKIFPMIVLNSARFARDGRTWNNYSYEIPGEWNGKYKTIKVIGDKKGGKSTKFFTKKADIFDKVDTSFGIPVKYIHVMRNPYDLISTLFLKRRFDVPGKLRHLIDACFLHIDHVEALRAQIQEDQWHDLYHESLLSDPDATIRRLFHFLELDIETGFIENCKKILFTTPHKSRLTIEWPIEEIEYVASRLSSTKRFSSYSFHS
jgi:hypothetical protein